MTASTIMSLVLLAVILTASNVLGSSYPTEVIELTDANFEHDTQAASGQTTGVWAVLFTDSTVKRHERAVRVVEELAEDEEKELIYAQVDVARNVKLARRFGEVIFPPCILLFRNRQMYLFDPSFDRDDIAQQISDFVTSGFALADPLDVPEPRDRQLNMENFEASTSKVDFTTVAAAVLMIVGGLLFQTWAIMNKDKFKPEPGTLEAARAAAAASTATTAAMKTGEPQKQPPAEAASAGAPPPPAPASGSKAGRSSKGAKKSKGS